VRDGHEPVLGQFGFATIGDGDFGRTLDVSAAVIGGERVDWQALDDAADKAKDAVKSAADAAEGVIDSVKEKLS
jgi:hypothetical protein